MGPVAAVLDQLLALDPGRRRAVLGALTPAERAWIAQRITEREAADRYARYRTDPAGFVTELLGETVWSNSGKS